MCDWSAAFVLGRRSRTSSSLVVAILLRVRASDLASRLWPLCLATPIDGPLVRHSCRLLAAPNSASRRACFFARRSFFFNFLACCCCLRRGHFELQTTNANKTNPRSPRVSRACALFACPRQPDHTVSWRHRADARANSTPARTGAHQARCKSDRRASSVASANLISSLKNGQPDSGAKSVELRI